MDLPFQEALSLSSRTTLRSNQYAQAMPDRGTEGKSGNLKCVIVFRLF
jgi:hypothetical protein